jgi:UDP-N-acetylmuramoylalanine--D-glutamate ligase
MSCTALVLSPGVPLTHPKPHWTVDLAKAAGIDVIGDIELFCRQRRASGTDAPFIAITGTNGKSTTTALIAHVLGHAGRDAQMGGNIGKAVLSLDPLTPERIYVIECSSYQIDLAPTLDPAVGILLNLSPDHLERHGSMDNYASIKQRLVAGSRIAIIGTDDAPSRRIAAALEKAIPISKNAAMPYDLGGIGALRGHHNAQNACAAYWACRSVGLSDADIQAGFASFPGLVHRMEQVGFVGDVLFINDSKATNADAAAPALSSFGLIYWIAGGLAKDGGIEPLRPLFNRIAKAYLIGEAAPAFSATLGEDVRYEISGTLEAAVAHALHDAQAENRQNSVVMLSPACASFDQFPNFEKRGEAFKRHVTALDGFRPAVAEMSATEQKKESAA